MTAPAVFVPQLTERQREVLRLIADGRVRKEVARELHISPDTVKSHMKCIYAKLGARTVSHAVHLAHRAGYL